MDKVTLSTVLGTILGLAAGVFGMMWLAAPKQDDAEIAALETRIGELNDKLRQYGEEHESLTQQLEAEKRKSTAADDFAAELGRSAQARSDAEERAERYKTELDALKTGSAEDIRQRDARIRELERILGRHGIIDHLSDEEVAARVEKFTNDFNTAMATGDKKRVIEALHGLQDLGPRAFDNAIELWMQVAEDFGLHPMGGGENTLGLRFQDFVGLIKSFGMIEKGLTDPHVPDEFRITALYSAPWWVDKDAAERVRLVGNVLLGSQGYESIAAIQSLRDIPDASSTRYLAEYLGINRDDPEARREAIKALVSHDSDDAWDAIRDAAENDKDESVRKEAQDALDGRSAPVDGVRVTFVSEEGQGALAGIRVGDIITHYNGVRVGSIAAIVAERDKVEPDASVQIVLHRAGESVTLTLGPGVIGINGVAVKAANND
jgi:hypothetical protein